MNINFWGVRGSIPTPGRSTVKYGGNTSCIQVLFQNGPMFILDAGTGIRELGKHLMRENQPVSAYIFISHFHWDHIQGLPFFRPAFQPENQFMILGSDDAAVKLDEIISFQMEPTYFPITIEDMRASINFRSIKEEKLSLEGVEIETIYLNHPGYALGFRFTYNNRSLVYISDNEPFDYDNPATSSIRQNQNTVKVEEVFDNFVENRDERLIAFCRDTDVLIHDTQYLPEEYENKKTWGHSPYNFSVNLALKSKCRQLILFHHDPDHDDEFIDEILDLSRKMIRESGSSILCQAAREGLIIEI